MSRPTPVAAGHGAERRPGRVRRVGPAASAVSLHCARELAERPERARSVGEHLPFVLPVQPARFARPAHLGGRPGQPSDRQPPAGSRRHGLSRPLRLARRGSLAAAGRVGSHRGRRHGSAVRPRRPARVAAGRPLLVGDTHERDRADDYWTGDLWECVDLSRAPSRQPGGAASDVLVFSAYDDVSLHHALYLPGPMPVTASSRSLWSGSTAAARASTARSRPPTRVGAGSCSLWQARVRATPDDEERRKRGAAGAGRPLGPRGVRERTRARGSHLADPRRRPGGFSSC